MEYDWWEAKRQTTLAERGLDFRDAFHLFDGQTLYSYPSPRGAEERVVSVGLIKGRCIAVVWMDRGAVRRIISMRRARDGEEKRYRALFQ